MPNFDTIGVSVHGMFDKTNSTLEILEKENRNDYLETSMDMEKSKDEEIDYNAFLYPAHIELYRKLLIQKNRVTSRTIRVARETQTETLQLDDLIKETTSKFKHNNSIVVDMVKYEDGLKSREYHKSITGSNRLSSAVSDVQFILHPEKNRIDFEFSIPKYLYGHSLAQFIPQVGSNTFYSNRFMFEFREQIKMLHHRLMNFVEHFMKRLERDFKLENKIVRKYVSIFRLDICYNQYFETKEDALFYLDKQKKINKKRQRRNTKFKDRYGTTLEYKNSNGAYFKIYHKGTEYIATGHDLAKHRALNKIFHKEFWGKEENLKLWKKYRTQFARLSKLELTRRLTPEDFWSRKNKKYNKELRDGYIDYKKSSLYDINFLKNEMDLVLRYELSVRPEFFAYHYKRKLFCKNDAYHQDQVKNYKRVHSILMNNKKETVTGLEMASYEEMKKFYDRTVVCMIEDSRELQLNHIRVIGDTSGQLPYKPETGRYDHNNLYRVDMCYFSEELLKSLIKYFIDLLYHYKIEEFDGDETIISKLSTYNSQVAEKRKEYNANNQITVMENNMNPNNKQVKTAFELLTQKEKLELDLRELRITKLTPIAKYMDEGHSLDEAFDHYNLSGSNKSRYKAELEKVGIGHSLLKVERFIPCELDYTQYYWKTQDEDYKKKFYTDLKHSEYN